MLLRQTLLQTQQNLKTRKVSNKIFKRGKKFDMTGGRTSISGVRATVFGATGNIGRIVVERLGFVGSQVIVPFRGVDKKIDPLKTMGELGAIVPLRWDMKNRDSIRECVQYSNVVINCTGSRYESFHHKFEDVHIEGPRMMALAAKEVGATFVHVSALGADVNSKSRWLKTKALGEQAVLEANPDAIIIRPAPYYGRNDNLNRTIATMFKYWPFFVIFHQDKKIQPIDMTNIVDAIVNAAVSENSAGHVYEIAGDEVFKMKDIVGRMRILLDYRDKKVISLPPYLEYALLKVMRMFKFASRTTRLTMNEFFDTEDKILSGDHLGLRDLGITPHKFDENAFTYVQVWRQPQRWDALRPDDIHNFEDPHDPESLDYKIQKELSASIGDLRK
eukprot:TRINITY_DN772_c0_g1_i1.p1 TRINITY_DN772_c0_g1~~TRINITY_DN772_c0_g1_i1.p1  ORF type:complete len:389 (+),score=97.76 TRINITY_DN772_c0_g1_i1:13-1179(+)